MRRLTYALIVVTLIAVTAGWLGAQTKVPPNYVTGPVWDDLVSVAGAVNPLGADGQATVITDAATYIGCLEFDTAGETAVIQWQLSHGIAENTDIHPHIHWLVSGADVTGTATFEAKFRHCPLSGTCSAWSDFAAGTVEIEPADAEGGTGLTEWVMADATYNFGISDIVLMQFKLTATTVTDAVVCSADIHIQKQAEGSRQETVRCRSTSRLTTRSTPMGKSSVARWASSRDWWRTKRPTGPRWSQRRTTRPSTRP